VKVCVQKFSFTGFGVLGAAFARLVAALSASFVVLVDLDTRVSASTSVGD